MIEPHFWKVNYGGEITSLRFYLLSDLHVGSRHCREDMLTQDVKRIADDAHGYWFGLGDYGDWISYSDKRFENYEMATWLDISDPWSSTLDRLEKILKPIAGKCLGLVRGNHEERAAQQSHLHMQKMLCARLGVIDLGDVCLGRLQFVWHNHKSAIKILLQHGWGGGRTGGVRVNKLESLFKSNDVDVICMGHMHGQVVDIHNRIRAFNNKGKLSYRPRVGINCKTYLEDSEYEQRAGYEPSVVGMRMFEVRPEPLEIVRIE